MKQRKSNPNIAALGMNKMHYYKTREVASERRSIELSKESMKEAPDGLIRNEVGEERESLDKSQVADNALHLKSRLSSKGS